MKLLFMLAYAVTVLLLVRTVASILQKGKPYEAMISLFLTFLIVPDFIILDAYRIPGTFVLVLVFVFLLPVIGLLRRPRIVLNRNGMALLILLLAILLSALLTKFFVGYSHSYYNRKLFNYIYTLVIPIIIVICYRDMIIKSYPIWRAVLLYAVLAYAFKNYALIGISGFRDTYMNIYPHLKNIIFASQTLVIGSIIAIYELIHRYSFKLLLFLGVVLLQVLLFESRGPLLGLICSIPFLLTYKLKLGQKLERLQSRKIIGVIPFVFLAFLGLLFLWNSGHLARIADKIYMFIRGNHSEARYYIYPIAIEALKRYLPAGIGFGNSGIAISQINSYFQYDYPHNLIIELFLEEGLAITVGVLILLISWILALRVKDKLRNHTTLFYSLYIFALVCSMFSGDISGNRNVFLFGFLAHASFLLTEAELRTEVSRVSGSDKRQVAGYIHKASSIASQ